MPRPTQPRERSDIKSVGASARRTQLRTLVLVPARVMGTDVSVGRGNRTASPKADLHVVDDKRPGEAAGIAGAVDHGGGHFVILRHSAKGVRDRYRQHLGRVGG